MDKELKNLVESLQKSFEDFKTAQSEGEEAKAARIEDRMNSLEEQIKDTKAAMARAAVADEIEELKDRSSHEKAFIEYARKGKTEAIDEFKALNTGEAGNGGVLVPPSLEQGVIELLRELTPMRMMASVKALSTADYNRNYQTGHAAAGWVTETGTRNNTQEPTFGQFTITPHELYAEPQVSLAMIEDAQFDIEAWLAEDVAKEFATVENAAFTTGTGSGQPKGLSQYVEQVIGSPSGNPAGAQVIDGIIVGGSPSSTISGDDLFNIVYDLKPQYRAGAAWAFNRATLNSIRQIKDLDGRYLFEFSQLDAPGIVGTLLGYPVYENEDIADVAPGGAVVGYFGDFKKGYTIVDRVGMSVLRNPYKTHGFVSFYTRRRVGGGVEDANALRALVTG